MGSVGFHNKNGSQPSTSNSRKHKLPKKLLDDSGAVNHASVPRKLRSAIKKRGRDSTTSPLPIFRKQIHLSKDGARKSKRNMKEVDVTKDEEEVAETLYALAELFSEATKKIEIGSDEVFYKAKSSVKLKEGSSMTTDEDIRIFSLREEPKEISKRVKLEAEDKQVAASAIQFFPQNNGIVFAPISETQGLSNNRFPASFWNTNCATQPRLAENSVTNDKGRLATVEPKKSWKSCSAHVYIARLIQVLKKSDGREGLVDNLNQLTANIGLEPKDCVVDDNQMREIDFMNSSVETCNGAEHFADEKNLNEFQNAILFHKKLLQDQQQASKTPAICYSSKQGSNLLSSNGADAIHRVGYNNEYHVPHHPSQNHSTMHFFIPQNGYSSNFYGRNSALTAQQDQLPPFLSSSVMTPSYNPTGHFPDWQNRERDSTNYALYPHLHSTFGSKYQQISPPVQHQFMTTNSPVTLSNVNRHYNRLPLGFERNGADTSLMQLLFNQNH